MGEEDEVQKLKRIAAAAYDYENDPRWAEYWSNILIPPHMASRSDVVDHFKCKFYQRYIVDRLRALQEFQELMTGESEIIFLSFATVALDPGLVVESMSLSGSSQSSRQAPPPTSSSTPANDQARHRSSGSSTRTSGSSGASRPNPPAMRWDRQTIQFSVNAWVFVLALLSILPIVPKNLSNRAYRLSFIGTGCSSLYSLYTLYGKPRAWNLQAVQVWLQSVIAAKDFIYFIYSLILVVSHLCLKFASIPILCRTLEHVVKFLRRNFSRSTLYRKYLEEPCVWVESNTTTLSILSSNAEVGLGFLLIISLFSWQRNIIQTFMYWQLLKLMYHAPVTAGYHQSVWSKIGRSVSPAIQRYAPFLNTLVTIVQRWWFR